MLAQGEVPHTIAVNATHVFWTDVKWIGGNGEAVVRMVSKTGGDVSELFLEAGVRFYAIAVDDQTVYVTSEVMNAPTSGRILSASIGTHEAPRELATGQYAPRALELSKSGIVWVNISGADRVGHVFHQPFAGGMPAELATDALDSWTALALSSENAFWTSTSGMPRLSRAPLAGGGATVLIESAEGGPIACVTTDGTDVYLARRGTSTNDREPQYNHDGSIHKLATTGGTTTVLASNQESPSSGLAARDGFLYWVNDDGSVFKLPTAGGTPASLVPASSEFVNPAIVCALALDECHAYFLSNRAVYKVRR